MIIQTIRFFAFVSFLIVYIAALGQDNTKTIEVTGTAQRTVVPDEIYASISLQEYNDRGAKVDMVVIEEEFIEVSKRNGISLDQIEVENINGYQSYDYESGILFSKSYRVKAADIAVIEKIARGINEKGITSITISYFGYSDQAIKSIEDELRKEALADARDQAEKALNDLGKKLVDIVSLEVTPGTDYYSYSDPYETPEATNKNALNAKYILITYYVTATYSFE